MRPTRALAPLLTLALGLSAVGCSTIGQDSGDDNASGDSAPDRVVLVTHEDFSLPKALERKFEQQSGSRATTSTGSPRWTTATCA